MNANEYIAKLKASNPKLFAAKKLELTPQSLENQIRTAFEAGANKKSLVEEIGDELVKLFK